MSLPRARTVLIGLAVGAAMVAPARAEGPVPWLGITFNTATGFGAHVVDVHPGTAAAAAGLEPDDEITEVGQVPIAPGTELWPLVSGYKVGARMPITFVRNGRMFRVAPRLTARPPIDEIVYQRLIDRALPALELYDRGGEAVPFVEWQRPLVWVVFDAQCESCGAAVAELAQHLDDGPAAGLDVAARLRVVMIGVRPEVDAYLARVPIAGTVWRADRGDPMGVGSAGQRLISALDLRNDGAVLVTDQNGQVTFATAMSAGDAVHDGACAAAARAVLAWRRSR